MNRILSVTKCVLLFCLLLPGQKLLAQGWMVDLNFIVGNPQNEFEDNVDATGFGGSLAGGYYFPESPIMIGADFSYMIYGSETREEFLSPNIPVEVDVETSNNIFQGHLLLRLQSPHGNFRPYLDGLLGFNYLFTQTQIENQGSFGDDPIAESTNFDDTAFSYGVGGGAMLKVATVNPDENEGPKRMDILINFGVRYMFGGEAEYLKEGSIQQENGQFIYDVSRSNTDLITYKLGVVFGF